MKREIFKISLLWIILHILAQAPALAQKKEFRPHKHFLSLTHDNDALQLGIKTDDFYSFGIIMGYRYLLGHETKLSTWLRPKNSETDFTSTFGAGLFQKGYTPEFSNNDAIKDIRPFAGILASHIQVSNVSKKRLLSTGITFGVRGPASGAEWSQDNFHQLIGNQIFEGWENQLSNKFLYGGTFQFYKPVLQTTWVDLILESDVSAGNYLSYLQQGARIRIGKLNPIHRSALYQNQFRTSPSQQKFELFATARIIGRLALVDATLSIENDGPVDFSRINKSNLMAGYEVAFFGQWNRLGIYLARTRFSSDSNFSVKHSFGSIGFSFLI